MRGLKRVFSLILSFVIVFSLLPGCQMPPSAKNPVSLSEYAIVYSDTDTDYAKRAAEYIQAQIKEKTGLELPLQEDSAVTAAYEIVVGNTERKVSQLLDAETDRDSFALMAHKNQIALEGDYFLIAAAAYYFVQTYITGTEFYGNIPTEPLVCKPITQTPDNYFLLIGDGMGPNQTKLFETLPSDYTKNPVAYTDSETIFYGYYFPNQGFARTDSLSGVTDSAASGTALASGYKTFNNYIGQDQNHQPVKSLTELGNKLGKATAVLSTDVPTGATPAAFSAHADDRNLGSVIRNSQETIKQAGTLIHCGYDVYTDKGVQEIESLLTNTVAELEKDPDGFFMMYEEAHIDKHSHNNDITGTYLAVMRFNQVIGRVMEYAFYHPNTFVLITADHETGMLLQDENGQFSYKQTSHSGTDVPVFAFGEGSAVFNDVTVENVQIPKTIAKLWGVADFGDTTNGFPALG